MIISFYSYKGGVGRSQLCANVAAYLCFKKGKKVLLWDWDFEAPGLHFFFDKKNNDIQSDGTIEMLEEYVRLMRSNPKVEEKDIKFLSTDSIVNLREGEFVKGNIGRVDLIPGGNYNERFVYKVNSFNWFEFYELLDGITYIEKVKEWIKSLGYDYVLIDSRTGINDYSGICNIQLPDTNLIVTAANEQNLAGSKRIIEQILNSEYTQRGFRKSQVLPILSRIDTSHPQFEDWLSRFVEEFSYLLDGFDSNIDQVFVKQVFKDFYLSKTCLEYVPAYSAGENLLITSFGQTISNTHFISKYVNIGDYLDNLTQLGDIGLFNQISKDDWLAYAEQSELTDEKQKTALAYTYAEEYDKAIIWGGTEIAFYEKGNIHNLKGEFEKAIEYYQKAIELNPEYSKALFNLGFAYNRKKEFEKAIECYLKAISINANDPESFNNLGNIYNNNKDFENAIKCFQKAITLDPEFSFAFYNMGVTYRMRGDFNKAIECFQKAAAINPNDLDTLINLGVTYNDIKEFDKAIEYFQKVISLDPTNVLGLNGLGFSYIQLGNLHSAEDLIRESIKFGNTDIGNMNLGHIYLAKGEQENAIAYYKIGLDQSEEKDLYWKGVVDDFQYLKRYGITEKYYKSIIKKVKSRKSVTQIERDLTK